MSQRRKSIAQLQEKIRFNSTTATAYDFVIILSFSTNIRDGYSESQYVISPNITGVNVKPQF